MQIVLFTPPADEYILLRDKDYTARHWRRKPPQIGSIVAAQTGRKKSTKFAELQIRDVFRWNGKQVETILYRYIGDRFSSHPFILSPEHKQEIATREGFTDWDEFYYAYYDLNKHHWDEPGREHYFLEFEMLKEFPNGNVC